MDTPSFSGGLERFSKRKDVDATLSSIADATADFNLALADTSPDYDSLVVFSYAEGAPTAVPLVAHEAPGSLWYRHRFRKETIENRGLVLSGTALGKALRDEAFAGYASNEINTDAPQMVYTERLLHEGRLVGAIQNSFTPAEDDGYIKYLPGDTEMEIIAQDHHRSLAQTAAAIALLQSMAEGRGSLGLLLEQEPPIAPDSFIIRTDIFGASYPAHNQQQAAYEAYRSQTQVFLRQLIENYQKRYLVDQYGIEAGYSDQGDGSYVVLPLPKAYNPYDNRTLTHYHQYTATPFMKDIQTGLEAIAQHYQLDIIPHPQITVSGAFGNVEVNGAGRFVSPTMTELTQQKSK